jgi:hypothetical protein
LEYVEPKKVPNSEPFDPSQSRESVRGKIALRLVWLLIAVISMAMLIAGLATLSCTTGTKCSDELSGLKAVKTILDIVVAPLVGLVGSVIGFYFGEKAGSSEKNRH